MLRVFIALITSIIIIAYIAGFIISLFIGDGVWLIGLGALLGFYIAWSIAGGVIFSPLSYFVLSDWDLFKKKLKYSTAGSLTGALIGLLLGYLLGYFG